MFLWPVRSEVNAIRVPSGDQTGFTSSAGSEVSRILPPRTRSKIQISRVLICGSRMQTGRLVLSGGRGGVRVLRGLPNDPDFLAAAIDPLQGGGLGRRAAVPPHQNTVGRGCEG